MHKSTRPMAIGDDFLSGIDPETVDEKDNSNDSNEQASKTEGKNDSLQSNLGWMEKLPVTTEDRDNQLNVYIGNKTRNVLDEVWLKLRRETDERVSKSDIAEAALLIAFTEYTENKDESLLREQVGELRKKESGSR